MSSKRYTEEFKVEGTRKSMLRSDLVRTRHCAADLVLNRLQQAVLGVRVELDVDPGRHVVRQVDELAPA